MGTTGPAPALPDIEPVATLLRRVRAELSAEFLPDRPIRVSRAPGRLDVMGGIADYTGSLVCEYPLDRAAAVALQERDDRDVQVFSLNLSDEGKPSTFRIPLDALAGHSPDVLRRELNQPGRKWAGYISGCLVALNAHAGAIGRMKGGVNLAVYSTVPLGAGVSSSAALEVATMMNLAAHLGLIPDLRSEISNRNSLDGVKIAELCQWAENHVVGAPCGIMDQMTACLGEPGALLRMICQPAQLLAPVQLPDGIRVVGINSNVKHDVGGPAYGRTRCAAFMGHRIIFEKMREMGRAAEKHLVTDPMSGYLANLDPDDYKNLFRSSVPEHLAGREFLERYGPTSDAATTIEPDVSYAIRHATDHHVLEARRVRRFVEFLEKAKASDGAKRKLALDSAGHLMYASHQSYTMDAMLGAEECDLLVSMLRRREPLGIYGARITGGGSGGTVAVLAGHSDRADGAIAQVMSEYEQRTGRKPELFSGTSPGAWHAGTAVV